MELAQSNDTSSSFWKRICGGQEILNIEEALNSSTPHFNDCFNHVVLSWPISIFLLLGTIYQIYALAVWRGSVKLKWTWIYIMKMVINISLFAITSMILGLEITRILRSDIGINLASNLAVLLIWLCILDLLILTESNRRRGYRSSGVIFIAWCILIICGILQFVQIISDLASGAEKINNLAYYQDILYLCFYPFCILELILNCFADAYVYDTGIQDEKAWPEDSASFLSQITFSWVIKLAIRCYKHSLNQGDLWNLKTEDTADAVVPPWEKRWHAALEKQRRKTHGASLDAKSVKLSVKNEKITTSTDYEPIKPEKCPSMAWNLLKTFKGIYVPALIMKCMADTVIFANPLILKTLLAFIDDPSMPLWIGILFAFIMLFFNTLYALLANLGNMRMYNMAMKVRTCLTATTFKKAFRLSTTSRKGQTTGEMVNLMAVDIQRMSEVLYWINNLWTMPLTLALGLYLLYNELGYSALAGFCVMLLLMPANLLMSRFQRRRQVQMMAFKDQRMKLMNEILNGMKVLKLYAWEEPFEKKVLDVRKKEISVLRKGSYWDATNAFTFSCAPFLIAVASFTAFVLSSPDHILTPQKAFVSLSLFNLMRPAINYLPMMISSLVQASVSNKRLKKFLAEPELNTDLVVKNGIQDEAVLIQNGTFAWSEGDEKSILTEINLSVNPGQLVAIVGPVGCGKSSLLSAILGDMEPRGGVVYVKGSVAYVPQQAWIQSQSVRSNITFMKPYIAKTYNRVVDACALKQDFDVLPDTDMTEIGEKGINLSGGQKQRVSLARSVYQERDIYLMDDPLSAVDAHVGRHIFDEVIGNEGLLKGKTRILVTHGLAHLKHMDNIFVIKDGKISDSGTLKELLHKKGPFAEFLEMYLTQKSQDTSASAEDEHIVNEIVEELQKVDPGVIQRLQSTTSAGSSSPTMSRRDSRDRDSTKGSVRSKKADTASKAKPKPNVHAPGQNIKNEEVQQGKVQWKVYKDYIAAVGCLCFFLMFAAYTLSTTMGIGLNVWLSEWSQDSAKNDSMPVQTRLIVYASLGVGQGLFIFLAVLVGARFLLAASAKLHQRLLHSLMRFPMSFYDVTPLGAIISRVGKDVENLDTMVPIMVRMFIMQSLSVISSLVVIIIGTPTVGIAVLPLAASYYLFQKFYVSTSRQLRRLQSASRSPIYSHFGETINGVSSIRAYGVEQQFIDEAHFRIDENMRSNYAGACSDTWMMNTLQCAGNILVLFAALLSVLTRGNGADAGLAGLSITYAMTITTTLMMSVFSASNLETNIVAAERVKEYSELPTEAPWITDIRPPHNWPSNGVIDFEKVELRYRDGQDLVLKGLDWHINSMEKVGVVGRTGAGKSSTTLALFRIVEPASGKIVIDSIDISKIGLHDLRSKLAIIPQDPVLFSGTLRNNLDPFEEHADSDVWTALEHAHLKPFVSELNGNLQYQVTEGGENLSVGQRQLLCLARALLRRCRILVLDEATAAVDLETERLILETIRSSFAHCTIITIAHRLNTIMDSDRILVMAQGRSLEYDSPLVLLSNSDTTFYAMASEAGLVQMK